MSLTGRFFAELTFALRTQ